MTDIDIDKLADILAKVDVLFVPFASRAVLQAEVVVKEIIGVYPPQPARDRAKTFNTYVRGKGRYPKSAFVRSAKEPGGYKTKRVKRAQIRMTSERMNARFDMRVSQAGGAVTGTLKNTASYSAYVIGSKSDKPGQQSFHAATGWQSKENAISQAMPKIDQIADNTVKNFLGSLF